MWAGICDKICIFWKINNKFVCILWKWLYKRFYKKYDIFLHIPTSKQPYNITSVFYTHRSSVSHCVSLVMTLWNSSSIFLLEPKCGSLSALLRYVSKILVCVLIYFVREEGSAIFWKYYKPSKHNLTRVIYQSSLLRVTAVSAFLLAFSSILIFSLAPYESLVGHQFPPDQVETSYCFSFSHAENLNPWSWNQGNLPNYQISMTFIKSFVLFSFARFCRIKTLFLIDSIF